MIVKHDSFNMQTAFFEEKWNLMKMIMSTPGHRSYEHNAHATTLDQDLEMEERQNIE